MTIELIDDPYSAADWGSYGHEIGQFHVHPNYSSLPEPAEIIDSYHDRGYSVLNVQPKWNLVDADGNACRPWPWTDMAGTEPVDGDGFNEDDWDEDRDPEELGMIAVQGSEITGIEHLTTFFSDFMQTDAPSGGIRYNRTVESLEHDEDAITMLAHPARYHESDDRGDWGEDEWRRYITEYRNEDRFLGLEAISGSFGTDERILWDDLLTYFSPFRKILGTAVDDNNDLVDSADVGRTVFLMDDDEFVPGHETGAIRDVFLEGRFYCSTVDDNSLDHPTIESIEHDEDEQTITVTPSESDHDKWIANGNVIHEGRTLDYGEHEDLINGYARFEGIVGEDHEPYEDETPGAVVFTQPFRFGPNEIAKVES